MTNEKKEIFERNTILELLSESITNIKKRIDKGRIRDEKKEKLKVEQYRALVYMCNTYNTILKDKQIDKMNKQIEEISSLIKNDNMESGLDKLREFIEEQNPEPIEV
jgi:hypothetical protein